MENQEIPTGRRQVGKYEEGRENARKVVRRFGQSQGGFYGETLRAGASVAAVRLMWHIHAACRRS